MDKSIKCFEDELISLMPKLKRYSLALTKNIQNSEDLLSETILLALKNRSKFNPETNLNAWVYTIMRNSFINDYRRSVRSGTTLELKYAKGENATIEADIDNKIQLDNVHEFINQHNKKMSVPITLFSEGYKYEEISQMTGVPIGTVKSRIFLMREKLLACDTSAK